MTTDRGASRLRPRLGDHGYHQLRLLARALATEAGALPSDLLVLDLGCGGKPYRELFSGPYLGIDLSADGGSLPDALATAEALPIADRSVGAILSTQQLEHVTDPTSVLAEARRVLDPSNGTLLLSTHGVWVHHPDPLDLWRWTEQGLIHVIEQNGFRVERVHRQGDVVTSGLSLMVAPFARAARHQSPIVRGLARATVALVNVVGYLGDALARRVLPRHYASMSYLVVARRT